jgi:hypothetical protein
MSEPATFQRFDFDVIQVKVVLAGTAVSILRDRNLTHEDAALLLRATPDEINALDRSAGSYFSIERLLCFLDLLGQRMRITIEPRPAWDREPVIRAHVVPSTELD